MVVLHEIHYVRTKCFHYRLFPSNLIKLPKFESLTSKQPLSIHFKVYKIIHGFTLNDAGLLVIFVMNVAVDGLFFNNLADDSDIIKSGPKIDTDN